MREKDEEPCILRVPSHYSTVRINLRDVTKNEAISKVQDYFQVSLYSIIMQQNLNAFFYLFRKLSKAFKLLNINYLTMR